MPPGDWRRGRLTRRKVRVVVFFDLARAPGECHCANPPQASERRAGHLNMGKRKLTDEQAAEIRRLYFHGPRISQRELGKLYGCSGTTIHVYLREHKPREPRRLKGNVFLPWRPIPDYLKRWAAMCRGEE
jgi:hypothetical protein